MGYARPTRAFGGGGDFANSHLFEMEVKEHLSPYLMHVEDNTNSTTGFDFTCFAHPTGAFFFVEVKERRQKPSKRWSQRIDEFWTGFDSEKNLFILDELSLRKATEPHRTFFVVRLEDGRLFLNSGSELASFERVRLDREGAGGHLKGKLNYDLRDFRPLESLDDLWPTISDLLDIETRNGPGHHLVSECVSARTVERI